MKQTKYYLLKIFFGEIASLQEEIFDLKNDRNRSASDYRLISKKIEKLREARENQPEKEEELINKKMNDSRRGIIQRIFNLLPMDYSESLLGDIYEKSFKMSKEGRPLIMIIILGSQTILHAFVSEEKHKLKDILDPQGRLKRGE